MDVNETNECLENTKEASVPVKDSEMNNLEGSCANNSERTVEIINPQSNVQTEAVSDTDKQNGNMDIQNSASGLFPGSLKNGEFSSQSKKSETSNGALCNSIVKTSKPLCADYRSDSDSESFDSESDSSLSSTDSTSETSSDSEDDSDDSSTTNKSTSKQEDKKSRKELTLYDLPPIEDLRISLPEDACVEVGVITSIVDTLVVVESHEGSAALDVDTVLFLDSGKRTLGKVFDILGPITKPVYAVRFNTPEQIKNLGIEKGLKVFYAPKTQHTTFVFMSEVLKNKGSDASWKDNVEAPPEFQDFSDDEEERLHKHKNQKEPDGENSGLKDPNKSRKRTFGQFKQNRGLQQNTFRNPNFSPQRRPNFQRHPPPNQFAPPHSYPNVNPLPYTPYPGVPPAPPHMYYPPRITGPPFPAFGGIPFVNQNFHQPYYQQRAHPGTLNFGPWGGFVYRPPPPPPPAAEGDHQPEKQS